MKKYDKEMRFEFKMSLFGFGKTTREALEDAKNRLENDINDYCDADWKAIETHEVISISEE